MKSIKYATYAAIVLHAVRKAMSRFISPESMSAARLRQVMSLFPGNAKIPALLFSTANPHNEFLVPVSTEPTGVHLEIVNDAMTSCGYHIGSKIPGTSVTCHGVVNCTNEDSRLRNYLKSRAEIPTLPLETKCDYMMGAQSAIRAVENLIRRLAAKQKAT